ncbi:MAG: AAA family ATPase [Betaproteobacteria bacterium]|nr:AAA family ATPase [Betaproteobacteria bacterium]
MRPPRLRALAAKEENRCESIRNVAPGAASASLASTPSPVILAALVTEDPLLLIGPSGTGKTYLLNTLSETLGLEHRHYNASLISFDDLVGFPYPDPDGTGVRFLQTPATVWGAQSVLIDEISRCKPEHQNRLFALVHERRVQGIALPQLRWRWAAMNPCSSDQSSVQDYAGSEPLDPALADRFALFVSAADWADLTRTKRRGVVDPGGEGASPAMAGAAPGGRRLARHLRAAPAGVPGAGHRVRPRCHHGAQRRRDPHLAAPGATPRPQSPRRRHRDRQDEGPALPHRAHLQPAARLLGRSGPCARRSRPPTAPRGTPPAARPRLGSIRSSPKPGSTASSPCCSTTPRPRMRARRRSRSACRSNRRSAPVPSPLPCTRRRRWVGCQSAPRASTTWPRSRRRSCRSRARSAGANAMARRTPAIPRSRASPTPWPACRGREPSGPSFLRLVHGREAAAREARRAGAPDRGLRRGAAGTGLA